jgi:hypothetical protein
MEISVIPKPQSQVRLITAVEDADLTTETVNVLNQLPDSQSYQMTGDGDKVFITKEGQLLAEIGRDARIKLYSLTANLAVAENGNGTDITWSITDMGNEIAQVIIHTGAIGDVNLLEEEALPTAPGVYLRKLSQLPQLCSIVFRKFQHISPRILLYR